jgi:hypothetical protein
VQFFPWTAFFVHTIPTPPMSLQMLKQREFKEEQDKVTEEEEKKQVCAVSCGCLPNLEALL